MNHRCTLSDFLTQFHCRGCVSILRCLGLLLCVIGSPVFSQNYNFAPIDKLLTDSARTIGGFRSNSATIIMSPSKYLFTKTTGQYTLDSITPIASASKWLSAGVIMSLVDEGLLSLDDTCGKYLPTFKGAKSGITIRQLMSHTSGLPGNSSYESNRKITLQQAVDSIGLLVALVSTPGTQFRYGGASMQVAGRIAEIVTGEPWDSIFAKRIARPLGITRTDYEGLGQTDNPQIAGGAQSTAEDYAKFLTMLLNKGLVNGKRLLSENAIKILSADQTQNAVIASSPFDAYSPFDTNMAKSRYGIGNWVETPTKSSGAVYDNSSQGAFGFTPWIDWNRNVAGVIAVRSLLRNVVPTYIAVKLLLRDIIDEGNQQSSSYQLTVSNGYGSGKYNAGDTVHIFAREMSEREVFGEWQNNANLVFGESRYEWHSQFIMPASDVNCTATFRTLDSSNTRIRYEQIRGVAEKKNVYYAFPTAMQGVAYLFHGSGGSARGWLPNNIENVQLVKDLLADSIGVIITECEERTLNTDTDGDGNIRWKVSVPILDSSIDYRNLKIITDTMIARGLMSSQTPRYTIGMSNGGAFSIPSAVVLGAKAAVSYCASGRQSQMTFITTPVMYCMAKNDDNENVGQEGNAEALRNTQILSSRGIDTRYLLHPPSPLYAERFKRGGVDSATGARILNDLQNNGILDTKNRPIFTSDTLLLRIQANPTAFPSFAGLSTAFQAVVRDQYSTSVAEHKFYSDYNRATIAFLKKHKDRVVVPTSVEVDSQNQESLSIYPNPASESVTVMTSANFAVTHTNNGKITVYDMLGNRILQSSNPSFSIEGLANGIYVVQCGNQTVRLIIQK